MITNSIPRTSTIDEKGRKHFRSVLIDQYLVALSFVKELEADSFSQNVQLHRQRQYDVPVGTQARYYVQWEEPVAVPEAPSSNFMDRFVEQFADDPQLGLLASMLTATSNAPKQRSMAEFFDSAVQAVNS